MSVTAEKVAEVLALSPEDRAFLAQRLIASLDDTIDTGSEADWQVEVERRSQDIESGRVVCRPVDEALRDIRAKINARRHSS